MHTSGLTEADRGQRLSGKLPAPLRRLARGYSDWNYGWQADIALRYVPVADALASRPPSRPRRSSETSEVFLDVGCGSKGGVTSYVPVRTVGVDLAFNVGRIRRHPAVTPVVGSGLALPVADASVDVALCMDTLEHLSPAERTQLMSTDAGFAPNAAAPRSRYCRDREYTVGQAVPIQKG